MSVVAWLASKFKQTKQTTFCWCPVCRWELCAGGEFLIDDEHGVKYRCAQCKSVSRWDFDAPVPLLLECSASEWRKR